ncbi:MAG: glycoside hydrolase family 88 protein [bacterium]|nr:glycoside hydrolase family 88 protein [bacterium]
MIIFLVFGLISPFCADAITPNILTKNEIIKTFETIKKQVAGSLKVIPRNRFPIQTDTNGKWQTTTASGWTSGFYPGILWLLYEQSGNKLYAKEARLRETFITSQQFNTVTHDVGFMIFNSFGNAYRISKNSSDKKIVLRTAQSLATRYNPKVGLIKSWDGDQKSYQVIIDNLMNLELLFWASKNGGDPKLMEIAKTHAKNTARDFVRKDGSTFHLVNYNPANAKILSRTTAQGYAPTSTWARGQAWAIYGFTIAYRETGDKYFLTTARKTADFYINNLPADFVPYWDFSVPNKMKEPRDSSAAAIATSGLLELAKLEINPVRSVAYRNTAGSTLASLSSNNYLNQNIKQDGILLHGTYNKKDGNFDRGTVWGDYYFIEALLKYRALTK